MPSLNFNRKFKNILPLATDNLLILNIIVSFSSDANIK